MIGKTAVDRVQGLERAADFFVSRAGADAPFADRIGRILKDAGPTGTTHLHNRAAHFKLETWLLSPLGAKSEPSGI